MTGLPLIMVPGLGITAAVFDEVRALLPPGADVRPVELPPSPHVDVMAERILAAAPERFALAGFSLGGYVALAIMARAAARVERLALLSTGPTADPPAAAAVRDKLIGLTQAGKYDSVPGRLAPAMFHPARKDDPALLARFTAMSRDCGPDNFVLHQRAALARPDRRWLLPEIKVPTLVAVGRDDLITPPALSEGMAQQIPGATLMIIENCGHLAPLEQPAALATALAAWLK